MSTNPGLYLCPYLVFQGETDGFDILCLLRDLLIKGPTKLIELYNSNRSKKETKTAWSDKPVLPLGYPKRKIPFFHFDHQVGQGYLS